MHTDFTEKEEAETRMTAKVRGQVESGDEAPSVVFILVMHYC